MTLTESSRGLIVQGLRTKKQTRKWLAEQMGLNKSWVTRLLNGEIKSLTDEQVEKLQGILEIRFFSMHKGSHTTAALDIAAEYDSNQAFAKVVGAVRESMKEVVFTPKYIPTQQMATVGNEIIRIAFENEDKPGKVARLVLELLA